MSIAPWEDSHVFGQDKKKAGEQRALLPDALKIMHATVEAHRC